MSVKLNYKLIQIHANMHTCDFCSKQEILQQIHEIYNEFEELYLCDKHLKALQSVVNIIDVEALLK